MKDSAFLCGTTGSICATLHGSGPLGSATRAQAGRAVARSGLPEECSACDERTKANRPAAAKFAQQRLGQRKQRFKPVKSHLTAFIRRFHDLRKKNETRPFPKVKPEEVDAQEDEEEEEADPGSDVDFSGDDPSSGGDLEGQPQQQQLLRELAQARAAIQTLAGQVEAQQTQLNQMSQARRDSRLSDLSGMIPANEWLRVSNQGASSSFNPIVDTRTLGKPEIFKSDPSEYCDWSFVLKSYLACISPDYIDLLDRIAGDRKLSTQLCYILVMLVKGRALDVVQNTGPGEGAESMRRLEEMFHLRVASRFVGTPSLNLSTRFSGDDPEAELEAFEKTIRRYEEESSKSIDDEMLMGIIINSSTASRTTTFETTSSGMPCRGKAKRSMMSQNPYQQPWMALCQI